MQTNATPVFDTSVNTTGCCAKFNPAGWDDQVLHFDKKPLCAGDHTVAGACALEHGKGVFAGTEPHFAGGAADPSQMLVLSRDPSAFAGEHLFAVTGDVPGEEMTTLSGDFLTQTFEGPFSQVRAWYDAMQAKAHAKGREPGEVWFFYTTCPNCAKAYGANPVVGVVELAGPEVTAPLICHSRSIAADTSRAAAVGSAAAMAFSRALNGSVVTGPS